MAEWKKEIRRLAIDFYISREETLKIFKAVENTYGETEIPSFYNGNRNEFLYDKAQREIMNIVYA